MSIINNIDLCRICSSTELTNVISLGEQYITSRFPLYGDFSTPKTPIDLCICSNCRLLQLRQTTFSSELYEYEYGYRSGISNTMREHLKQYQEEIVSKVLLNPGDTIVDIGSNDSTMLQYYSNQINRIGVDPTGKQFSQYYGSCKLLPTYFTLNNFKDEFGEIKCKIVSSISMFYDLPEPVVFAQDVNNILDDEGIWTCEQSYLINMLDTNSIDTICHEHLEYYSLKHIKYIADHSNFKIIDIKFNDCNGGSFRIYFAKQTSQTHTECTELINDILKKENDYGLNSDDIFETFMKKCDKEVKYLNDFIDTVNKNGKKIYIYGASTKGNCLLQYANIGEDRVKYAVERNLTKVGKMTNTGIEIISEETMRKSAPDYLLVLPWHFKSEIVKREADFLNGGGQFIFPFPNFEIIGSKPKLLITGCDGMIANYVLSNSEIKNYNVYGFGHSNESYMPNITKMYFDIQSELLEHNISIIKPDIIIHLASISCSKTAFENPLKTINLNGLVTAKICDIIYRNKWNTKLFNASSSEIYKGHIDYLVSENDSHKYHTHPYSIAKILGHTITDFYRQEMNQSFSNGTIFTVESKLKKPIFLLNKVAHHIRKWKQNQDILPLSVGNLDSHRNILHATDVASAIFAIILQETPDNYLICNSENYIMKDLVFLLFKYSGIEIEERDNVIYDKLHNKPVIIINNNRQLGIDSTPTNIRGESVNLKKIGWTPKVSINEILQEIIEK